MPPICLCHGSVGHPTEDWFVFCLGINGFSKPVAGGTPEDHQVYQGITAQTVGTVNRHASLLTHSIKYRHDGIGIAVFRCDHLAMEVGALPVY